MKYAVNNLGTLALDWAVATIQNLPIQYDPMGFYTGSEAGYWVWSDTPKRYWKIGRQYSPSTSWAQGGPIIESQEITIKHVVPAMKDSIWQAHPSHTAKGANGKWGVGPTPLIAAMRCYVATHLGEEIDIPRQIHYDSALYP